MQKEIIYLGFASLKGGVGKSSVAEVLASYLYYECGVSLLVVDCDYSQYSFFKLRERDRRSVTTGSAVLQEKIKAHFSTLGKGSFPILASRSFRALTDVQEYLSAHSEQDIKLVLFDLPGRADDVELINLTLELDYVISPIEPDRQSLVASMSYALSIRDLGIKTSDSRIKQIYMLWNKIDGRVNPKIIHFYDKVIQEADLGLLETRLPRSARFAKELVSDNLREVFRCTYLAPDKQLLKGSGIAELADEVLRVTGLKK